MSHFLFQKRLKSREKVKGQKLFFIEFLMVKLVCMCNDMFLGFLCKKSKKFNFSNEIKVTGKIFSRFFFFHFTLVNNISINDSGLMCFMMENCLHFPWLRETK